MPSFLHRFLKNEDPKVNMVNSFEINAADTNLPINKSIA